jgi:PncC family amidohydrolase
MNDIEQLIEYFKSNDLQLTTAESCTAGKMIEILACYPGSGSVLDAGYVVYSPAAKTRLLGVSPDTIEAHGLTSEEVSRAMAEGALKDSPANIAVATTGVAGPDPMDDIAPGTVCIAWGFRESGEIHLHSETRKFDGDRNQVVNDAAHYALVQIPKVRAAHTKGESNR